MAECVWTNEQKIALRDKLDEIETKLDALIAKDEIWKICGSCKGTGERKVKQTPEIVETCPDCGGTGKNKWGNTDTPA